MQSQLAMARSPFPETSVPFRLYYAGMVVLGVALGVVYFPSVGPASWPALFWWVAFVVAADVSAIRLPRGRAFIAVSSSLDYAAIALFGPPAAALIAVLSTSLTQLVIYRRPPHRVLFNICLFIVTIMAAGYTYRAFGGVEADSLGELMLPLGMCGLVYFAVNTGAVSLVIGLSQNENPWRVWQSTYGWTLIHLVAFVSLLLFLDGQTFNALLAYRAFPLFGIVHLCSLPDERVLLVLQLTPFLR